MATTWRPKAIRSGKAKFFFPKFTPPTPAQPELLLPWEDRPGPKSLGRWTIRVGIYFGTFVAGLTMGLECPEHRVLAPNADHPAAQPRPADANVTPELEIPPGSAGPCGPCGPLGPFSRLHDRRLFAALAAVESGGRDNVVGDQGRSRGRYQIQRAYWAEGCRFGRVAWSYDRYVADPRRCEQVMRWYWAAHGARTPQAKARIHNGGPAGMHVGATAGYWAKVRRAMVDAASCRVRNG
jgi:hypothetical protein